jgi:hypothetical protein
MKIESIRDITKIASAGTLYSPACNLYKLTVKDTGASPIDLSAEADATNTLNGTISAATQAAPGVITTSAAHGLTTGDQVIIRDVQGMTEINGGFTVIVTSATTFNITHGGTSTSGPDQRIDTTGFGAYTTGGTFTSGEITIETVEAIVRELNPMAYFTVNDASGVMYIVMDRNTTSDNESVDDIATRVNELQKRVRSIGKDTGASTTSIGPNDIDISGSTVEAATGMTFTV